MSLDETRTFELTEDHLILLEHANVRWTDVEYGAPGLDPKRPFGNSSVELDIAEILDLERVDTYEDKRPKYDKAALQEARDTYHELDTALSIVLTCQTFEPGTYEADKYRHNWRRVSD